MIFFYESIVSFISWMIVLGLLPNISYADVDRSPTLSSFALKMKGVCSSPQFIDDYTLNCTKSSSTIQPNAETASVVSKVPVNAIMNVEKQNDMIITELINRALSNSAVPPHEPQFGLELLNGVFAIYAKTCPAVPASFFQTVYHLFSFIHWKTGHDRQEYLPKLSQKWIARLINNCSRGISPPTLLTDLCKETVMSVENCSSYICTEPENEFRLIRTDPIVDIVFKSMELVQAVCFPYFKESYRMFHLFHLTIMDIFTDDIKTRWVTQLQDSKYWERLLGPNFETHLINLERCNQGIIPNVKFHYRIPRSSLPARIRLGEAGKIKVKSLI